ncbi:MAG TPA: 3-methyl-2-oxobutanoate hydroxymethyltransferase [Elusimicrobiota bacterium]|nr:3-methyl-2-oxobutanoate hydroxymethyltransferase [Elusimicrobiota bacterium]
MTKMTVSTLQKMKQKKEKICVLTCYDASMARLLDQEGVDVILVGDSVGNVKMGHENTIPVTVDDMLHYTRAVKRGNTHALLVADMPFLSYETDPKEAVRNAGRLIKDGGAEAVKVEGGLEVAPSIKAMVQTNIPVMGHLGLTPQAVNKLGGYKVQGKTPAEADRIVTQAKILEGAGVFAIVLEAVPPSVAQAVTEKVSVPTIGIGAGPHCDGQVLVLDDMLGLSERTPPKFVKRYASLRDLATAAVRGYKEDVQRGRFPSKEHTYDV